MTAASSWRRFEIKTWNRQKTLDLLQQYLWNAALGKPIDRCRVLVEIGQAKNDPAWLEVAQLMFRYAREGSEVFVSRAMQSFPKRFPAMLTGCVREAELRGQLDGIVPVLERSLRVEVELSGKVFGPLRRILFIFLLSQAVLVGVSATQLGTILKEIEGRDLSQYAIFALQADIVRFIHDWPWLWVLLQAGLLVGGVWGLKQPRVLHQLEALSARLSSLQVLLDLRWLSFLGALQVLLKSGVLFGDSLERAAGVAGFYLSASLAGIGRHMQIEGNTVRSFLRRGLCLERIRPEMRAFLATLESMEPQTRIGAIEARREALVDQTLRGAGTTALIFEGLGYLPIAATVVFLEAFIIQFSVVLPKLQ
ncbi:MAG: hypothetical protein KME03_07305 [Aphanocapsa lilacina HA4352-LM1]|jgi:type II secretory pathway component PulF|nr:hypothetical protein [Aphanocapsa lilacina HA4352-LM1]